MKFSNDNRASLLIINMIFEVVDPDLTGLILNSNVPNFYEIWHSKQIGHANYKYINWIQDLDPILQICEMWSQN